MAKIILLIVACLAHNTQDVLGFTIPQSTAGSIRQAPASITTRSTTSIFMSDDKNALEVVDPGAAQTDPMEEMMEEMDEQTKIAFEKAEKARIHKCTNCDWEYDETKGDSMMIGGMIKPDTTFEDLPADWRCPVCRASKDAFVEVVEEIPGFEVNQGYGFGTNAWTAGQKNLAIFGGLAVFFLLFLSGYAMS
ncbi:MAG: hypothetical protein SGARI_006003 [Bacillariaceae sp.]